MSDEGIEMNLPELELTIREVVFINDLIEVHIVGSVVALQFSEELASDYTGLAGNVTPLFGGFEQGDKIFEPVKQVPAKTIVKRRTPPGNALVAGIGRRGIDQEQLCDALALRMKLPRHFVGDVAAETVAAEQIRPVGLQRTNFIQIIPRHILDFVEFVEPDLAAGFNS